uniref:Uncharacterized protein n=1 Tax=Picea glauca TaxID=3330 RepID=A0A117NGX7_PICGL|nr:hypothetical protein ABT39_MTgene5664 [Picea glauca]
MVGLGTHTGIKHRFKPRINQGKPDSSTSSSRLSHLGYILSEGASSQGTRPVNLMTRKAFIDRMLLLRRARSYPPCTDVYPPERFRISPRS